MISLAADRNLSVLLCMAIFLSLLISCHSFQDYSGVISNQPIKKTEKISIDKNNLQPAGTYGNITIKFMETAWDKKPWSDRNQSHDSHFVIHAVHGAGQKVVFLGGNLLVARTARSFLLRSVDGGHSWQEVMRPVERGCISEILFIENGFGWAIMKSRQAESESAQIYFSKDYGETWTLNGSIPGRVKGLNQIEGMRFVDVKNGEIWVETENKPDDHRLCLYRTIDGGRTWQSTNMCCAYERYSFGRGQPAVSTTSDSVQWQYQYGACCYDNQWIRVQRRKIGQIGWETVAAIPDKLNFINGHFVEKNDGLPDDFRLLPERSYGNVTIKFLQFPMEKSPWFRQILSEGVKLHILGIYSLSQKNVLIYGGFESGGFFRSVLLRSSDGGHSWREAAVPIELGYVSEIFFIDGGMGWALVKRVPEGIENVYLYQTLNSGKTWQFIGQAPNQGGGSYNTLGLRFVDPNYGEIWMERVRRVDNANDIEEFCLCRTTDGGLSWQMTEMCIPRSQFNYNWISPEVSTLTDGTQWRYRENRTDENHRVILIQRKTGNQSDWETVSFLPLNYVYKQGVLRSNQN